MWCTTIILTPHIIEFVVGNGVVIQCHHTIFLYRIKLYCWHRGLALDKRLFCRYSTTDVIPESHLHLVRSIVQLASIKIVVKLRGLRFVN